MKTDKLVIYLNTLIKANKKYKTRFNDNSMYFQGKIDAYKQILWAINEEEKYNVTNADKF
jgi:hypothetical protein